MSEQMNGPVKALLRDFCNRGLKGQKGCGDKQPGFSAYASTAERPGVGREVRDWRQPA